MTFWDLKIDWIMFISEWGSLWAKCSGLSDSQGGIYLQHQSQAQVRQSFVTSKPLLTIALKILKTIEKPLVPMVGPPKKHSMVMVQLCQNHWKTIDGNGGLKKNINHSIALKNSPSLWSIGCRHLYSEGVFIDNKGYFLVCFHTSRVPVRIYSDVNYIYLDRISIFCKKNG